MSKTCRRFASIIAVLALARIIALAADLASTSPGYHLPSPRPGKDILASSSQVCSNPEQQARGSGQYDGVRHLHGILRERFVLVLGLTVYADESGTHDLRGLQPGSEVTTLAGYIATKRHWDRFTQYWKRTLKEYGVEEFHMSAYWREEPPYDKWTDAKRKRFLKNLIKIARDETWFAIGAMVPTKDWNRNLPDDIKKHGLGGKFTFEHPYHFCFLMFFAKFMDLLTVEIDKRFPRQPEFKEKVAFVFERQDQFAGIANTEFQQIKAIIDLDDRFASLTFGSSECYVPLQAADLLAFYARRIRTHGMQGKAFHDPFEREMEKRKNLMLYSFTRQQLFNFGRTAARYKAEIDRQK